MCSSGYDSPTAATVCVYSGRDYELGGIGILQALTPLKLSVWYIDQLG